MLFLVTGMAMFSKYCLSSTNLETYTSIANSQKRDDD